MLAEPECRKRKCNNFQGVFQPNDNELPEFVICRAFPNGIPDAIAYGTNKHTKPFPGDNGIHFEKKGNG